MRQILLLNLIYILVGCNVKKQKQVASSNIISSNKLVEIIRDSSFQNFKRLINIAGYSVIDTLSTQEGEIIYSAEEDKKMGNLLSVTTTKDYHVIQLRFFTYSKALFDELKQNFIELEFKSLGNSHNVEEFENSIIYISAIASNESYNVILVRKE